MKAATHFETALLILLMAEFYPGLRVTSKMIGDSAGCNPVVVRNLYTKLKAAGLLDVKPGMYGLHLGADATDITLWDVYDAVTDTSSASLFGVYEGLAGREEMGDVIHGLTLSCLDRARDAMRAELEVVSLYEFAWHLPDTRNETREARIVRLGEMLRRNAEGRRSEPALGEH